MAKKKTKAPANPARGFATVSTVSKTKVESKEETQSQETSVTSKPNSGEPNGTIKATDQPAAPASEEKSIVELTPEELEQKLEQDELQLLVEKYAVRVRRDVQRQIGRIQTDRRVLRSQAQPINALQWLRGDLYDEVFELARLDVFAERHVVTDQTRRADVSNEEFVIRCWTLARLLTSLGIAQDDITRVLKKVLVQMPTEGDGMSLWGFNEALSMLAVEGNQDLPPFDQTDFDAKPEPAPVEDAKDEVQPRNQSAVNGKQSKKNVSSLPGDASGSNTPGLSSGASEEEDIDVSDLDSDVEPDQLIDKYLRAKSQLFTTRPDLVDPLRPNVKKGRLAASALPPRPASPGVRKLQNKLKLIESDPFFDDRLASMQWTGVRNELAEQAALEKRLQAARLNADADGFTNATNGDDHQGSRNIGASQNTASEDDEDQMMAGMFASAEESAPIEEAIDGVTASIQQRNFGKMTGINPRRILEDACRARDTQVRLHYKQVSSTVYHCRHRVTINWAKPQERLDSDCHPTIKMTQKPSVKDPQLVSSLTFTSIGVSTPEIVQSEAFIATAAIFFIFADSPSDGRVNLRLPVAYKDVWNEFDEWRKAQIDAKDRAELKVIRQLYEDQTRKEEDDGIVLSGAFKGRSKTATPVNGLATQPDRSAALYTPEALFSLWQAKVSTPAYQRMLPQRMSLPMFGFRQAALDAIDKHQVLILCGETGCGQSTQLPAYVLEHQLSQGKDCKIYCTEPRRISAISLAQRVSEELGEAKNDLGTSRSLVGYAIRLETKVAAHTRLVYATVGIVLRMLESSRGLNDVTHLIIDEVHERSIDTDFLLIVLRSLMVRRPELKVILMSATVDATRFSKYLDNAPIVNVPGRTFPVQSFFLEDAVELLQYRMTDNKRPQETEYDAEDEVPSGNGQKMLGNLQNYSGNTREVLAQHDEYRIDFELIVRLIKRVLTDPDYAPYSNAILVFLPGIGEIRELNDLLGGESLFQHRTVVYPLHSSIASEEQQAAFVVPPPGTRKIVLATNIAETGITIPDVTCVIDTGKHKEMRYDERRQLSRLIMSFISRANAKQRRGRAGRVQEGLCFHLFSKYRHDELMAEQQTPEMLRLSLQDLVMRVKICKLGDIEQTLAQALDPPSAKNIRRAIDALVEVGALTPGAQELTSLGNQLAKLPLDANLGKLCLYSAIFSCLDVGLTVAAILSSKSPFVTPFGQRQAADTIRLSFNKWDSDLITAYNAYTSWRRIAQDQHQSAFSFCRKQFLSHANLTAIEDLKGQLLSALAETGLLSNSSQSSSTQQQGPTTSKPQITRANVSRGRFVQVPTDQDRNSANETIVTSVIASSFYPKILTKDGKGWRQISTSQSISLHPSSTNRALPNSAVKYLSYYSLMQSTSGSKTYNALSTTAVQDLPLLILTGEAEWRLSSGVVVIDGNRLRFRLQDWRSLVVFRSLRARIEEVLSKKLGEPNRELEKRLGCWLGVWERICGVEDAGGVV